MKAWEALKALEEGQEINYRMPGPLDEDGNPTWGKWYRQDGSTDCQMMNLSCDYRLAPPSDEVRVKVSAKRLIITGQAWTQTTIKPGTIIEVIE